MLHILPFRTAALRRTALPAQISIATPVSPQPPGAPIVVSGTYQGSPSGITLEWRQNGQPVSTPVAATNIMGGLWSATIATPSAPGSYTLRATLDGTAAIADSLLVVIEAAAVGPATIGVFTFEGTGAAVDTIALFGHAFERATLNPAELVVLRRQDNNEPLRTQINPLTLWDDGSVKTALLAAELPALAEQTTLATTFVRGEAHPDPGADLTVASALNGRSALISVFNPPDAASPVWTFDPLANIGSDRWHQGPLALSTRVMVDVPSSATGVSSVRLIVDVVVTKDGILELDVCFSNDRVHHASGGIATFGYTITIDGQTLYSQKPETGAARQLLQYSQWIRRYGRRASDGMVIAYSGAGTVPRPLFRPDFDLLVRSGVQTNYDRHRTVTPGSYNFLVGNHWNAGQGRETDPYWHWGMARGAGDVGGRTEIGYRTGPNYLWLTTGDRQAQLLAQKMFEAASTRAMYFADWDYADRRWLDVRDWPKMYVYVGPGAQFSDVSVPKAEKVGLPASQVPTHNTTNHITIDMAHHGSFNWTPALLSGRRLCYDGLAARSMWATFGWQSRNVGELQHSQGATASPFPSWRNFTPNHQTGRAWGARPWNDQNRAQSWAFRDLIDCEAILPDNYPNREFYRLNVEAWFNAWKDCKPKMESLLGTGLGLPQMGAAGLGIVNYMFSFLHYALPTALKLGIGGPNAPEIIEGWCSTRAQSAASPDMNHRYSMSGGSIRFIDTTPPTFATTWAHVQAKTAAAFTQTNEDWTVAVGEGDYHRNMLNTLTLIRDNEALSLETRARAAYGLTLMWSERRMAGPVDPWPRIHPVAFFTSAANTNSVIAPGMRWNYDTAPVIPVQTLNVSADAQPGDVLGIIRFEGCLPRNSNQGHSPTTPAWDLVSQPADNPFTLDFGGVLRLAPGKSLPTVAVQIEVRARTYEQEFNTSTPVEHVSPTVTITVNPVFIAPQIAPPGTRSVGANATEGAPVGPPLTATGTAPFTWTIQSGNANSLFRIDAATGQLRVNLADISAYENQSRNLVVRATGPSGLFGEATVPIDITGPVIAPAFSPSTLEVDFAEGAAIGTTIALSSLGGSPAATLAITSGNAADRWEAIAPNTVRNRVAIVRADAASYTLGLLAENSAGSGTGTLAITVTAAPYVWSYSATGTVILAAASVARRLRTNYTGPLLRAYLAADASGPYLDIGFDPDTGLADFSELAEFASGGQVYAALYDQSVSNNGLMTPGAYGLPQLTDSSGTLRTVGSNSRPTLYCTPGYGLRWATFKTLGEAENGAMILARRETANTTRALVGLSANATANPVNGTTSLYLRNGTTASGLEVYRGGVVVGGAGYITLETARVYGGQTWNDGGSAHRAVLAGSSVNSGSATGSWPAMAATAHLTIGYRQDVTTNDHQGWTGEIAEFVVFGRLERGTDRAAIRSNMESFFGDLCETPC